MAIRNSTGDKGAVIVEVKAGGPSTASGEIPVIGRSR
jgi:hypothetical protein